MKINHPSGLRQTNPKRTQFKPNFPFPKLPRLPIPRNYPLFFGSCSHEKKQPSENLQSGRYFAYFRYAEIRLGNKCYAALTILPLYSLVPN